MVCSGLKNRILIKFWFSTHFAPPYCKHNMFLPAVANKLVLTLLSSTTILWLNIAPLPRYSLGRKHLTRDTQQCHNTFIVASLPFIQLSDFSRSLKVITGHML